MARTGFSSFGRDAHFSRRAFRAEPLEARRLLTVEAVMIT